ncbi:hypothetical protein [Amycolatopsis sp. ATCC 39116]|uniref:hypothetical protein n=1 Tax=Amycolatopsis sp. (strain ATCC 39116 / 75iv2) TaxID=385957 RepID=UPI0012F8CF18|nr:hypothetical protein [Amycolatopsis sp. ATCC 39116]
MKETKAMTSNPMPAAPAPQPTTPAKPAKFAGLAWAALILGIVGVVGSPIIFLNNVTAVIAGVGFILGIIALFGTRKVLAGIGVVVCVAAIVFTVLKQNADVEALNDALDGGTSISDGDSSTSTPITLSVGETHRATDVDTTVANPRAVTTSAFAAPKQKASAIAFDVTLVNHSNKPLSTALLLFQATIGQQQAEQVFDSANNLGGTPTTDVLPGQTAKFTIGFVDPGSGDVTVQISSMSGDKIYFVHKR